MSESGGQNKAPEPEIFFRAFDRLQVESFLSALKHGNKSLAILSQHQELLSYYGDVVVHRLRNELPEVPLEFFMPADSDEMLERFNAILTTQSFDTATKPRAKGPPDKIWIIQDGHALGESELQLLVRLIQNFPGAGISTLVMFRSDQDLGSTAFHDASQFNTWALEMPTAEQKLNAVQQARRNGHENLALELFKQWAIAQKKAIAPPPSAASKARSTPPPASKTSSRKVGPAILIVSGLLLISVGISAFLHPDLGDRLVAALSFKSKPQLVVRNTDQRDMKDVKKKRGSLSEMPEVAAQGLKWLQGLPGDQFLLEFQTFSNVSNAEKFIASSELLKRAQIVPIYANDKPDLQFLVVDGPYRTTDIANKAASRLPGSAEVSIESVDSLRLFTTQNLAPPPKS